MSVEVAPTDSLEGSTAQHAVANAPEAVLEGRELVATHDGTEVRAEIVGFADHLQGDGEERILKLLDGGMRTLRPSDLDIHALSPKERPNGGGR